MIIVNGTIIEPKRFPDGTVKINHHDLSNYGMDVYNISWLYENDAEMFVLYCLIKQLRTTNPWGKVLDFYLTLPYLPNARMDRIKNPDEIFTLKYFAEFLNSLQFDEVKIADVHSYVAPALINHYKDYPIDHLVKQVITKHKIETLFFPDEGAMKRYSEQYNMPYAFGLKKRDWATGQIQSLKIVNKKLVKDKDILIIDDICSKGGTFWYSAQALKEAGANKIYLWVTHCEKAIIEGELIRNNIIEKVFTTDSIMTEDFIEKNCLRDFITMHKEFGLYE